MGLAISPDEAERIAEQWVHDVRAGVTHYDSPSYLDALGPDDMLFVGQFLAAQWAKQSARSSRR